MRVWYGIFVVVMVMKMVEDTKWVGGESYMIDTIYFGGGSVVTCLEGYVLHEALKVNSWIYQ